MKETVGFIGLGGMGLAMATSLLKAGFALRVYNRTAEKARPLLEQGAGLARSPAEAAGNRAGFLARVRFVSQYLLRQRARIGDKESATMNTKRLGKSNLLIALFTNEAA